MKKGLVTILTPCYNGEKFIFRLLDSVLNQDYSLIEMIIVDDGSRDKTRSVVEGYKGKFESKGYTLKYIYQENAGQAAAINKGLPLVEGEYFVWPDADDFFISDRAISMMVHTLENLDRSYGMVRCWEDFIDEKSLRVIHKNKFASSKDYLFYDYLEGKETHAVSGTHMVRMEYLDRVNPARHIFDDRQPQNFQILIPLSYEYKIHTINQSLFGRLMRVDSHSHSKATYEKQIDNFCGYQEIMENTLLSMKAIKGSELQRCISLCSILCLKGKVACALENGKANDARKFANEMHKLGAKQTFAGLIRLVLVSAPPVLRLFDFVVSRLRRIIKK